MCSTLLYFTLKICTYVHTHFVWLDTADALVSLAFALRNRHTFVADAKSCFWLAAITYDLCACFVVHLSLGVLPSALGKMGHQGVKVLYLSRIPR